MTGEILGTHTLGSPRSSVSGPSNSLRKERGAIAAQACDTCRSRKQRCDEQRPKCGTCHRFKLDCHYREPLPTKKDKTLVEILDRIKNLEAKFDSIGIQHASFPASVYDPVVTSSVLHPVSLARSDDLSTITAAAGLPGSNDGGPSTAPGAPYRYTSSVHQMLGWPAIQSLLESVSLKMPGFNASTIESEGVTSVLGLNDPANRLPTEPAGAITFIDTAPIITATGSPQLVGRPLNGSSMEALASAFFNTFCMCHPIVDRQLFMTEVLGTIISNGFTDSIHSTLAFIVFALGEMAILGLQGPSTTGPGGARPSGIKGGTLSQPPGLALFNEARRRMGFDLTECSLEAVQVFSLAGIYCEACSSHLEFWRMTTTASLACHALITGNPSELASPRGAMIRRCFWHCCIVENYIGIELGLPRGGLESLEDIVGPPALAVSPTSDDFIGAHLSLSQEHFASAIALRRLSMEAHRTLGSGQLLTPYGPGIDADIIRHSLGELAMDLEQWKMMLPPYLRWAESRPDAFRNPAHPVQHTMPQPMGLAVSPSPVTDAPSHPLFTTDLGAEPMTYPFNLDVQMAVLRSRYYYAKFNIYRQYVFKVVSYPDQISPEDAQGAAECLRACLKWPVSMSPTAAHKRLVPCLFFWTQNMLGILVLLHLSQNVHILSTIRHTLCGESFEREASETVMLYIEWIRDLKSVDMSAKWAWQIVRAIYNLEE